MQTLNKTFWIYDTNILTISSNNLQEYFRNMEHSFMPHLGFLLKVIPKRLISRQLNFPKLH